MGSTARSEYSLRPSEDFRDDPIKCMEKDCSIMHRRDGFYCRLHESQISTGHDTLLPPGATASAHISGCGLAYDASNKPYAVYLLKVNRTDRMTIWTICRRYREFKALGDQLQRLGFDVPSLPPKTLIGSFEPAFMEERRAKLELWLQLLLAPEKDGKKSPIHNSMMRWFLTDRADLLPNKYTPVTEPRSDDSGEERKVGDPVEKKKCKNVNLDSFQLIKVIGKGSFGKVLLVQKKEEGGIYAMKVLNKQNIAQRKQVEHTKTERRVLGRTVHPFIVTLHYAFQTKTKLYFVLDYCPGGEMFFHLGRQGCFPENLAIFYTAEISLALIHLHSLGVVYRDLKPENILIDDLGHIKLADFGLSKEDIVSNSEGANSFCGTAEYLAPEIIKRSGHGTGVDWWSLGMVLFEMITGLPPWYTKDRAKLFHRVKHSKLRFPLNVSPNARNLITGLLAKEPEERMGKNDEEIKGHPFFSGINWDLLLARKIRPPFVPKLVRGAADTSNFDTSFTKMTMSHDDSGIAGSGTFAGFTFEGKDDVLSNPIGKPVTPGSFSSHRGSASPMAYSYSRDMHAPTPPGMPGMTHGAHA
jgi:serum/glucocorticoid-regulated kinase 3